MDIAIRVQNIPFGASSGLISDEVKEILKRNNEKIEYWQYLRYGSRVLTDEMDRPIGYVLLLNKSVFENQYPIPYTVMSEENENNCSFCVYASEISSRQISRIFCSIEGETLEPFEITKQSVRYLEQNGIVSVSLNDKSVLSINLHEIRVVYPKKGPDYAWLNEIGVYHGLLDYFDLKRFPKVVSSVQQIVKNRYEKFQTQTALLEGNVL